MRDFRARLSVRLRSARNAPLAGSGWRFKFQHMRAMRNPTSHPDVHACKRDMWQLRRCVSLRWSGLKTNLNDYCIKLTRFYFHRSD